MPKCIICNDTKVRVNDKGVLEICSFCNKKDINNEMSIQEKFGMSETAKILIE